MKTALLSILTIFITLLNPYSTEMKLVFKNKGVTISTNSSYEVLKFNPTHFEFGVSEGKPTNSDFYINSNFFYKGGEPMGMVIVDGNKKYGKRKNGGSFYVKDGNGELNHRGIKENHATLNRLRTLIGQNKKGEIILIVSKIRLDAKTILEFGTEYDLVDAVFCDGGTSVDYYFNIDGYTSTFKALSDGMKTILGIDQPPVYISGNFK